MSILMAISVVTTFFSLEVNAAQPECKASNGTNYYSYSGKVKRIYVNAHNIILIYFDVGIPAQDLSVCGFVVTSGAAAAFNINDNPQFAQMFYATALAAQVSGRAVTMHMSSTESGYLKFDRIWLAE